MADSRAAEFCTVFTGTSGDQRLLSQLREASGRNVALHGGSYRIRWTRAAETLVVVQDFFDIVAACEDTTGRELMRILEEDGVYWPLGRRGRIPSSHSRQRRVFLATPLQLRQAATRLPTHENRTRAAVMEVLLRHVETASPPALEQAPRAPQLARLRRAMSSILGCSEEDIQIETAGEEDSNKASAATSREDAQVLRCLAQLERERIQVIRKELDILSRLASTEERKQLLFNNILLARHKRG